MKPMQYLPAIAIFACALAPHTSANAATDFAGCKVAFVQGQAPKYTSNTKNIVSLCKGSNINFAVSFNKNRRTADFVAYQLTAEMVSAPSIIKRRNSWFRPDSDIFDEPNKLSQATRASYRNSGLDRGHLIKAEDMKLDTTAYKSTFLFSSIVPQFKKFNRMGWPKAERLPRRQIKNGVFSRVWIIAGVTGTHPRSKDMGVTVPSCFYRVMIGRSPNSYSVVALLMPNDNKIDNDVIVSDYVVAVDYLERIIGINLLPDFASFDYGLAKWGSGAAKESNNTAPACD